METISNQSSNGNASPSGVSSLGARAEQAGANARNAVDKAADAARPLIDRAAASAHKSVDDVADTAKSVQNSRGTAHDKIEEAARAARPAVDRLLHGAHVAVDKVSDFAAVAADTVTEKAAQLKDAHARLMTTGREQVREKPAVAVGIAVIAGFLLGRILGSRRE